MVCWCLNLHLSVWYNNQKAFGIHSEWYSGDCWVRACCHIYTYIPRKHSYALSLYYVTIWYMLLCLLDNIPFFLHMRLVSDVGKCMYIICCIQILAAYKCRRISMMTSSNGNIFRVTGHLCGECTGLRWIPRTKAGDAGLWCFLRSASE